MANSVSLKDSIATRLLSIVFALYFLVTLTVTLIHMGAEYLNTKQEIKDSLEIYRQVFENSLEVSLFDVNKKVVQSQISGILQIPTIVGVQIFNAEKFQLMAQGFVLNPKMETIFINSDGIEEPKKIRQTFNELFYINFPLIHIYKNNNKQEKIGEVVFYSSTEVVIEKVKYGFYFIVINSIIKTFALWIIFLLVSRIILSRPLTKLTLAAESVDLDQLENFKINIDTKDKSELKVLENAFNGMVKQLYQSHNHLREFTQQLALAKHQLESVLEIAKEMVSAHDMFTVTGQTALSIIRSLNLGFFAKIQIYFLEKVSNGDIGYANFSFLTEVTQQQDLFIRLAGIQKVSHSFSLIPPFSLEELRQDCFLQDGDLYIPVRRDNILLGLIILEKVLQRDLLPTEKNFIHTLTNFLALTLMDINAAHDLERTIRDRTNSLQKSLEKIDQTNLLLQRSNQIVKTINRTTDFEIVLASILENLAALIPGVQHACCMIYNASTECFEIKHFLNLQKEAFLRHEVPSTWSSEFFGNVKHYIGWGAITLRSGLEHWQLYSESAMPASVVTIPVTLDDELQAFFHFDNHDREDAFAAELLKQIGDLTEHITSAFIRARENKTLQENAIALNLALAQVKERSVALENSLNLQEKISNRLDESQHEVNETNRELQRQYRKLQHAQAQLIQSEKMAGLATMVAGTAHELNNPVNFVHIGEQILTSELGEFREQFFELLGTENDLSLLEHFQEKFNRFFLALGNINEGSNRIKTIVKDLRTFSRLDEAERKEIDLVESLQSFLRITQSQFQTQVEFSTDFQSTAKIDCWPAKLNQVFLNIILNACQAIQQKQKETGDLSKGKLILRTIEKEQKGIRSLTIQFEDNGCGMKEEVRQKIFEPFFTTKPVGQGTGLGMSSAYGIVKEHNGSIEVTSSIGIGTTITVFLPL